MALIILKDTIHLKIKLKNSNLFIKIMYLQQETKSFSETEFNVKLSGQMILDLLWYSEQFKQNNSEYWDYKNPDHCQDFCDEFDNLISTLRKPHKDFCID